MALYSSKNLNLLNFHNPIIKKYQKVLKNNHVKIADIEFVEDKRGKILLMILIQIPIIILLQKI